MNRQRGDALLDSHGRPFCRCAVCHAPLSELDLEEIGLRPPDFGMTLDDYCEAELVDPSDLCHLRCIRRMAG
jgi:hypothetical protein